MGADPWIKKVRKKKKKNQTNILDSAAPSLNEKIIGILSFEVAATMSRAIHLHRSLSDPEMTRLRTETLTSTAVQALVSSDEHQLLAFALAEKLEDLNRIAASTARLGRRCAHSALLGFEHIYADLLAGRIPDAVTLGFLSKDIEGSIRRMERLVSSTAALYVELEAVNEFEQSPKKFSAADRVLDEKTLWQRHDIKVLRDASLWNQSYDKVVLLLAQVVCAIHARIRHVFDEVTEETWMLSGQIASPHCNKVIHSGPIRLVGKSGQIKPEIRSNFHRPGRRFTMNCMNLGSSVSDHFDEESCLSRAGMDALVPIRGKMTTPRFGPKTKLASLALPSTVGGSALALHYANVILIIEKFLRYPHLVGEEARDDLYQMLPSSLRATLRRSLKSYVKNLAIYDAPLAHDWKEAVNKILSWLAPMAHNMIQWQMERNFEQQQIVLRANVLLLETLYFADREKTEEAICELLVGLNYICRYEHQQNALLDCRSSFDFGDCTDWKMKC